MKRKTLKVFEQNVHGARVFYEASRPVSGALEIPSNFAAISGVRVLIVGYPSRDVLQAAYASAGMGRLHLERCPAGESVTGLLVDLVA